MTLDLHQIMVQKGVIIIIIDLEFRAVGLLDPHSHYYFQKKDPNMKKRI